MKKIYLFILNIIYFLLLIINKQNKIVLIYANNSNLFMNIPVFHKYLIEKKINPIKINYDENKLISIIKLSKAKIIFIDQTNYLLSYLKQSPSQIIVQLWHGSGAYKKVAFDSFRLGIEYKKEQKRISRLHGKYSYVLCSDEKLVGLYSKMFNLNTSSILAIGSPRMDLFYTVNKKRAKDKFLKIFNISQNINIVLYCPTFRKNYKCDEYILNYKQIVDLESKVSNIKIFIKSHPNEDNNIFNFMSYIELLSVADILISDYSSIIFDFSFFKKPIILYTPDLDKYQKFERNLYYKPNEIVNSSMVAYKYNDLIKCLKNPIVSNIWDKFMSANVGNSCDKLFDILANYIK